MKERPILFSGPMVNAILSGAKTQTRRTRGLELINENPEFWNTVRPLQRFENVVDLFDDEPQEFPGADATSWIALNDSRGITDGGYNVFSCPYGAVGDRLLVRERMRVINLDYAPRTVRVEYVADGTRSKWIGYPERLKGTPVVGKCLSYGGFREASRIMLEITGVRVERLNEISNEDAFNEGWGPEPIAQRIEAYLARDWFIKLWDQINGKKHPWESNPFVWVLEFKKL